jgi:hypothetical protein
MIICLFVAFVYLSFLHFVSTRKQRAEIKRKLKILKEELVFIGYPILAKAIS